MSRLSIAHTMSSAMRRILIADDHNMIRRGIRTLIEANTSFEVVAEAADGRTAVDAARASKPDIAIIEFSLPQLNGVELTSVLKRELPRIEVLIYTMHDREDLIAEALRAGARGYVLKSDPEQHVLRALDALAMHRPYFSEEISGQMLGRFLEAMPAAASAALTHREREVVQLIAEGRSNREIGMTLSISVKTVETHRASAMHKLKLHSTAELVRYAVRANIIQA